jgi:hypothetical protein
VCHGTPGQASPSSSAKARATACRVGLPYLDQLVPRRPPRIVEHAPGHDHAFADRLALPLDGEVGLGRIDIGLPEDRREHFDALRIDPIGDFGGVAKHAAAVRREVQPRLSLARLGVLVQQRDLVADHGLQVEGAEGAV